jgi:hypothetical protein
VGNGIRQLLSCGAVAGLLLCQTSQAFAWIPLISGLTVEKKLSGEVKSSNGKDFYDPPNSPAILGIAEFLTQYLPEHGFFFMGDQYTGRAGIDLRTLLLKQSSAINLPDNLGDAGLGLQTEESQVPALEAPALSPSIKVPKQKHAQTNASSDLKINAPNFRAETALTYKQGQAGDDVAVRSPDLLTAGLPEEAMGKKEAKSKHVHSSLLASSVSGAMETEMAPQLAAFVLWTMPLAAESKFSLPPLNMDNVGTFVECEFGTRFQSIEGRHLNLSKGRLLVSVSGTPVVVSSNLADVTVPPSAAAIVEVSESGVLKVTELTAADDAVSCQVKNNRGRAETINLKPKEELIVASAELTANDASALLAATKFNIGSFHLAKGSVDVEALCRSDALFNSAEESQKFSALSQLQSRLHAQNSMESNAPSTK